MIIDTHQHFWKYNKIQHDWISDDMAVIRRDFLPQDLKVIYEQNGVDGCIAVQAEQSLEENTFLLEMAQQNNFIKGVIGWVDFKDKQLETKLEIYDDASLLKGYRHIVQAESDPKFLMQKPFLQGIKQLEKRGKIYEILVFPHQLPAVLEFVKHFPNQQFIIDHMAKPYIKEGYIDAWALMLRAIGKYENISCKISGMITEADFTSWKIDDLRPYMEVALEAFGTQRILYGSDWPVCLVAGAYSKVLGIAQTFSQQLSKEEKEHFFYKNAKRIYQL